MIPINNPELVVTITNRYGYIYNVVKGSLVDHGDYVRFTARGRGFMEGTEVSLLVEEIGSVVEKAH